MSRMLVGLLVGAHFNPPAKWVLEHLPSGAEVTLVPEPDNPYDANAVKVFLGREVEIPEGQKGELETKLGGTSFDLASVEQMTKDGLLCLGHLGAENGKPLAKAQAVAGNERVVGNLTISQAIAANEDVCECSLLFGPDGSPQIAVQV